MNASNFILDKNMAFNGVFFLIIAICVATFIAAMVSSVKRGQFDDMQEVLQSMVSDGVFLTAFGAGLGALLFGQYTVMTSIFAAFIGYKMVASTVVTVKNGTYQFSFFESAKFNKLAAYCISTKTFLTLIGVGTLWYVGYFGKLDISQVGPQILILIGSWGTANGVPAIAGLATNATATALLTPNPRKAAIPEPVPTYGLPARSNTEGEVSAKDGEPGYVPAAREADNYKPAAPTTPADPWPDYVAFDNDAMDKQVKTVAVKTFEEDTPVTEVKAMKMIFDQAPCNYVQNLIDAIKYNLDKAEKKFCYVFGFTYDLRNDPASLARLHGYCGETPHSFESYITYATELANYPQHPIAWKDVLAARDIAACIDRIALKETTLNGMLKHYGGEFTKGGALIKETADPYTYTEVMATITTDWKPYIN